MADGFYLGKEFDPKTEALGEEFRLKPEDLTTHGIVIGMTGSGKTGLSIVLIEEALQSGVPVIVIDPKGDMGNLALAFPNLAASEFRPWIDTAAAAR
jgi:DNA helicase HerA-like ATPase